MTIKTEADTSQVPTINGHTLIGVIGPGPGTMRRRHPHDIRRHHKHSRKDRS